jgi:peptidoglycan/LPS O-acetylase OafA/YrhL
MQKIAAVEGLRGWLAWTVVISHIALASNISAGGIGPMLGRAGPVAVMVFIIISGFVISHLIITREEPFRLYIWRRFMRIFPLFAVMCVVGYFTMDLFSRSLQAVIEREGGSYPWLANMIDYASSTHQYVWAHVAAHLPLLHGAIGNNLLPNAQYAFNPPAWSISLEWQFYLAAPLILAFLNDRRRWLAAALVVLIVGTAYAFGAFGEFRSPSFLPGAAGFFAVGIASRLGYSYLADKNLRAMACVAIALLPFGWDLTPILIWMIFLAVLFAPTQISKAVFEGRIPQFLGRISYSIYLVHFPVLGLCHWALPEMSRVTMFFVLIPMVCGLTLLASVVSYYGIERPGIEFGSWVVRKPRSS